MKDKRQPKRSTSILQGIHWNKKVNIERGPKRRRIKQRGKGESLTDVSITSLQFQSEERSFQIYILRVTQVYTFKHL